MTSWPSHRRRQRRSPRIVPLILTGLGIALVGWLLYLQLRTSGPDTIVEADDRSWMSPGLFGAVAESPAGAILSWVDASAPDAPLVLLVGAPSTATRDWSAVQALLDRSGISSASVVPADGVWAPTLRLVADSALERARRAGRATVVITFGAALDSVLVAAQVGHPLRQNRLVAMAPRRTAPSRLRRWLNRLRIPLRLAADTVDARLGAWSGTVLVVHAQDDDGFRGDDAERLAAGAAGGGAVARVGGGGFQRAPQHPSDDSWRTIVTFITGRSRSRDVVIDADTTFIVVDSAQVLTAPQPPKRQFPAIEGRP